MPIGSLVDVMQLSALLIIAMAILGLFMSQQRAERRTRLQAAGQFIQRWNSPEFVRLSSFLFDAERISRIRDVSDPYDALPKDEFNYLIVMLNFFEEMALSVEYGLAEERLLRKYFAQSAIEVFRTLEPIIKNLRRERRNHAVFVTFEKLVGRWSFSKELDA